MRQIPYGVINFERIIKNNFLYIDKTKYIEKLEATPDLATSFYLRPGRFGKSLFTSMLNYYYGIEYKDEFEELFGNLYIGKNPTENKNKYYMLNFDFSGMDINENNTIDEMQDIFANKVKEGIDAFIKKYKLDIDYGEQKTPSAIIGKTFVECRNQLKEGKIYIIIDEYDNFTSGILKGNAEKFLNIVSGEGFVKAFYARIKEEIKIGTVERFFATGIAPVTLDSMTTGFNIATDVTRKKEFIAMCGFTHEEVKEIIKEVLPIGNKENQEKVYEKMTAYYDGYRFSEETEETVFNSTLVMYYLKEYLRLGKEPERKLDINIAANFEKLANLITLKNNPHSKEILECLMQNKELKGTITDKFNLNMELTQDDIISILFYFGYSTIKDYRLGKALFKIPNYVMSEIYKDYFLYLLSQSGMKIDMKKIEDSIEELALEGKIEKLCKLVEEYLGYLGSITWQRYDEKYVKGYMHSILLTTPVFNTYLEYNVKHNKYIDIAVFKNEEMGAKYQAIIEVKYIKKQEAENKQAKETSVAEKRSEALEQIKEYMADERLPKDNMKKFVVIYVGDKLELLEEVI